MAEEALPNGVRVSPVDRRGRRISPPVLRAAEEIRRRAIRHAERLLIDPAVASDLLEEAAATVSRAVNVKHLSEHPVRNLQSYLFRAFLRRVNRTHQRDLSVKEALQIHRSGSRNSTDPRAQAEQKILIDEFLMQCDAVTRDMFCRRMEGFSWKEIGLSYRISSHAAESRFGQTFQKVRQKLGLK